LSFFGILLFGCCSSPRHLRWIARAFVIMALLMAFHALLQDVRGYGFAGHRPVMSWRPNVDYLVPRTRFFGIFDDPNDMGQFLATAMPLCFVFFKKQNILTIVLSIAMVSYLYLGFATTLSRGSMIGLLASICVAAVMLIFRRRYLPVLLVGLMLGLAVIPFSGRFLGDAWERVNLWGEANWAFRTKPIFGIGLGMQTDYLSESKVAHNAYVSAYAELGVFGFFFWIALIWVAAVGLLQTRSALWNTQDPEGRYLHRFSAWGLSAFAGFCASAFFLSRSFIFPLFFLTAMFGAVPFLAKGYMDKDDDYPPRLGMTIRDVTIVGIPLSVLVIVYVYVTILILNMQR
ncbi:MAG: O-antigen ligase family protein, partial [Kiritimatiellia bacterium]